MKTQYTLGQVKATLTPFESYKNTVAMLGANQTQDIQPDGRFGMVAVIENGGGYAEVDANETNIMQQLWDRRGAQLCLIMLRAEVEQSQTGYWRDLGKVNTDAQYKLERIAANQNKSIRQELNEWGKRWL